jgi:high-affinity nickel permease
MFGLDEWISGFSDGSSLLLVAIVAVLLGLRHASDPDHIAAMTTLIAGGKERAGRVAARLGLAWGLGHGTSLFVFGLPIVLFNSYLPDVLQRSAETLVALVIVVLAVRLLSRWRNGALHAHLHEHADDDVRHVHLHGHAKTVGHAHPHKQRSALGAYGIGLAHGMGGSAGVSVLIVAAIESEALAVVALVILAVFTAVSMTMITAGYGITLVSRPVRASFGTVAPVLGSVSLAFGVWYAAAAWSVAPYPF